MKKIVNKFKWIINIANTYLQFVLFDKDNDIVKNPFRIHNLLRNAIVEGCDWDGDTFFYNNKYYVCDCRYLLFKEFDPDLQ